MNEFPPAIVVTGYTGHHRCDYDECPCFAEWHIFGTGGPAIFSCTMHKPDMVHDAKKLRRFNLKAYMDRRYGRVE
jgi:hypothetical protein